MFIICSPGIVGVGPGSYKVSPFVSPLFDLLASYVCVLAVPGFGLRKIHFPFCATLFSQNPLPLVLTRKRFMVRRVLTLQEGL